MPELPDVVDALFCIEGVFKLGVSLAEDAGKIEVVGEGGKVKGLAGREDDGLLGKVAVVWVVEGVWWRKVSASMHVTFLHFHQHHHHHHRRRRCPCPRCCSN